MAVEHLKFHHNGCKPGLFWVIEAELGGTSIFYTGNLLSKKPDFSDIADVGADEDPTYAMKFVRRDFGQALLIASMLPSFGHFKWHVRKLHIILDESTNN